MICKNKSKIEKFFEIESYLSNGAIFKIYLSDLDKDIKNNELDNTNFTSRILVMEDDVQLRLIIGYMLNKLGYDYEFAVDGEDAIKKYKQSIQRNTRFDVLIIDFVIPGKMNGKETIKRLLEVDNRIKAILSSGYTDDRLIANYNDFGFKEILPKPYEMVELDSMINKVINS